MYNTHVTATGRSVLLHERKAVRVICSPNIAQVWSLPLANKCVKVAEHAHSARSHAELANHARPIPKDTYVALAVYSA